MILQILLPTWPWKPWWLSIQTSYCQHTSTCPTLLCPHGQLSHSATTSYEAKHSSRVCWNPRGSLLQEVPIAKHGHFPLSGPLPYRYQLPNTWPVKNTTEKYHLLQLSKNTCTIEAHNSRERLLAVSLVEVSWHRNQNQNIFCQGSHVAWWTMDTAWEVRFIHRLINISNGMPILFHMFGEVIRCLPGLSLKNPCFIFCIMLIDQGLANKNP